VAQFRAGKASVTDLISAQSAQVNAQLQFVNAHIDLRVAESKIVYATGRDVTG
jgi:outer membrane protein TolC